MDQTLIQLVEQAQETPLERPFGNYEEEAIVALAIDHPEFFSACGRFMTPEMFGRLECQFVMAKLLNYFDAHNIIPTRALLRDQISQELTEDDPYEEILEIVDRKSQPREVPIIKDTLLKWARDKAFGLLYSEEAQDAYARGDYEYLENILEEANRIADVGATGFWFFENFQTLFQPNIIEHKTTGFPKLDAVLNNGGPSSKEVICWMAPTNVGKSVMLCNNAISSLKSGEDVLLITFELDSIKTAMRCLGVIGKDVPLKMLESKMDYMTRLVHSMQKMHDNRFLIMDLPPDECSVSHIYAILDNLKRTDNWRPSVIVLDYLDLMVSRHSRHNKDDYSIQKHVANEVRGLAKNENVLVYTATQTNRSAEDKEKIADLGNAAESYAKQFSMDYVVTLNQTNDQRSQHPPKLTLFVAKNRNGPKHELIHCTINYETMLMKESTKT